MVSYNSKSKKSIKTSDIKKGGSNLILHNDSINSFNHVIDTLCEVCNHNEAQAEQCAFITHHKGKCDIKKGSREELIVIKEKLINRKLSVTID